MRGITYNVIVNTSSALLTIIRVFVRWLQHTAVGMFAHAALHRFPVHQVSVVENQMCKYIYNYLL